MYKIEGAKVRVTRYFTTYSEARNYCLALGVSLSCIKPVH